MRFGNVIQSENLKAPNGGDLMDDRTAHTLIDIHNAGNGGWATTSHGELVSDIHRMTEADKRAAQSYGGGWGGFSGENFSVFRLSIGAMVFGVPAMHMLWGWYTEMFPNGARLIAATARTIGEILDTAWDILAAVIGWIVWFARLLIDAGTTFYTFSPALFMGTIVLSILGVLFLAGHRLLIDESKMRRR